MLVNMEFLKVVKHLDTFSAGDRQGQRWGPHTGGIHRRIQQEDRDPEKTGTHCTLHTYGALSQRWKNTFFFARTMFGQKFSIHHFQIYIFFFIPDFF